MNTKRDCQSCKYYKDGYCENLELEPNYPNVGCDDFEIKDDKVFEQTVAASFIFGMALGFASNYDEKDKILKDIREIIDEKELSSKPQENKIKDVLDKIKAEIIAKDKNVKAIRSDGCCFFTADEILNILNKYKAESAILN